MELKDKLRELRQERGLSQQALADAIFVSRSAVAKWESGLGLPNEASYQALLEYFEVSKEEFETENKEEVIVMKNKQIKKMVLTLTLAFVLIAAMAVYIVLERWDRTGFGLTSAMAADEWKDNFCIETADWDFYCPIVKWKGSSEEYIDVPLGVQKLSFGYQCYGAQGWPFYDVLDTANNKVMTLFSFKGSDGWHNFIYHQTMDYMNKLSTRKLEKVEVNGEEIDLLINTYFVTEEELTSITFKGITYSVVKASDREYF